MIAEINIHNQVKRVDLSKPIDISIEVGVNNHPPTAWYVDPLRIEPVISDQFKGSVKLGGSVNFNNIYFNPHGHCTHTESVGHITPDLVSVNSVLKTFFFNSQLISVTPTFVETNNENSAEGDHIITKESFEGKLLDRIEAIVIRTLPNPENKLHKQYSSTNWPYLTEDAAKYLADNGIKHLLIDLPSVDREEDGGKLLAHHAFWQYPENTRLDATITEMIYVPNNIKDGNYLLNLQIASFINDASPSKPVLYQIV